MRKTRRRKVEGNNKWMWLVIIFLLLIIAAGVNIWKPWEDTKEWSIKQLIPWLDHDKEAGKKEAVDIAPNGRSKKQAEEDKVPEQMNSQKKVADQSSVQPPDQPPDQLSDQSSQETTPKGLKVVSSAIGSVKLSDESKSIFDRLDNAEFAVDVKFSLNDWLKSNGIDKSSAAGSDHISYVASLLYEAVLKAGFMIGERQVHLQLPEYAAPGFDVLIEPDKNDLTFINVNKFPVFVRVSYNEELPVISLEGSPPADWTARQVQVKETKYVPDKLKLIDSRLVGAPVEKESGAEGYIFEVTDEQRNVISRDFYNPEPVVIWQTHNVQ